MNGEEGCEGLKGLSPKRKAKVVEAVRSNGGPVEFVFKLEGSLADMNVFELAPTLQSIWASPFVKRTGRFSLSRPTFW